MRPGEEPFTAHNFMPGDALSCNLLIVSEFMGGGNLEDLMSRRFGISLRRKIQICLDVARGLAYLHGVKPDAIIHRDIKPENVLLALNPLRAKIADLGEARFKTSTNYMTIVGTPIYTAPEILNGDKTYDESVDVYSFALILYYMLSSDLPWPGTDGLKAGQKAAFKNDRPPLPRHWDEKITQLLRASWDADPALRPAAAHV